MSRHRAVRFGWFSPVLLPLLTDRFPRQNSFQKDLFGGNGVTAPSLGSRSSPVVDLHCSGSRAGQLGKGCFIHCSGDSCNDGKIARALSPRRGNKAISFETWYLLHGRTADFCENSYGMYASRMNKMAGATLSLTSRRMYLP
eukprot:1379401-Amorphochlora_amoeboformis.AAC.1